MQQPEIRYAEREGIFVLWPGYKMWVHINRDVVAYLGAQGYAREIPPEYAVPCTIEGQL
jgi:hypothetical protein